MADAHKRQIDKIYRRNQEEKERVLRLLETENVEATSTGKVLQDFSEHGFPSTLEGILRLLAPLGLDGDSLPKLGVSVYPDPPSPVPLGWKRLGMRYFLESQKGQSISVVIANDGRTVIKRIYEDNGDIHSGDVIEFLQAWQKNIQQKQGGGRPRDTELDYLFKEWQMTGFDPKKKKDYRQKYIDSHPENCFAGNDFNQAMNRYKRKTRERSKSLESD